MWVATYSFLNEPKLRYRERSPIHMGTGILNIHGSPPTSIDGEYWTSRDSKGEVEFHCQSKKIHTKFEDAQQDEKLAD